MIKNSREPRRIIQAAYFDGPIGPVTAPELCAMQEDHWGILRDRLTDGRYGKPDGLIARCMGCGSHVFISTRVIAKIRRPFFSHYQGGNPSCPWYTGRTMHPEEVRELQYQGNQVSFAHEMLCATIDRLIRLDKRYIQSKLGEYLPPLQNKFGRYPDVYVQLDGLAPLAIEIQLSNTFQTEISGRCTHYEREGVSLLWVLYGIDPTQADLAQNFRDVIRRHRGNAFLLDREAIDASEAKKTLMLKCYLKNDNGFELPVLVGIDDLKFPDRGLPYFEDRIIGPLQAKITARRKPWFRALRPFPHLWNSVDLTSPDIDEAIHEMQVVIPDVRCVEYRERYDILRLIAVIFSIIRAANGSERNYATNHSNIKGMLNTLLNARSGIGRYALLIEHVISNTCLRQLLNEKVGEHIQRAKKMWVENLCQAETPEWRFVSYLIPEIFDPFIHETLEYFDSLPTWVKFGSDIG